MARHALGTVRTARADAADDAIEAREEREPGRSSARHLAGLAESNPLSGPIRVPGRAALGDTGIEVHPIALGAGRLGSAVDPETSIDVLDRFAALGGELIATSAAHGDGRSEEAIGGWLAERRLRERMIVLTEIGRHPGRRGLAPETIAGAVDDSLARLGVERIDVLVLRGDDVEVPLEESLGAVDALIAAGKVRAIGAAGFAPERLIEARVLAANGLPRFAVVTTPYSLARRRDFEGAPELVAHAQGLAVLPTAALGGGVLGGTGSGSMAGRVAGRREPRFARLPLGAGRRMQHLLAVLDEVAEAHGTARASIALAWLRTRRVVTAPVAGAERPEHVEALIRAAAVELHRSELVELDRASA
ncbi:aldo/keto reductase [Agromyces soli]